MGKQFLMIPNTTRSGSGIMLVPMKDLGAMIGPATSTDQGTLRGEGITCRTSRTEMCLLGRVTMPHHLHLAKTKCHPVMALRTMLRATCLRLHRHLMQVVACQTTSKVVLLATKADLLGIKAVTKVTKGTQARLTKVATLATKVATHHHPHTREATLTHLLNTKVVAILAMVVAALATQAKEATRTTDEHDHVRILAPLFQSTLLEEMVRSSINQTLVAF